MYELFRFMLEEGVVFVAATRAGRVPEIMDLWEDDVPWGNMALQALRVSH